jgi:hypothetical protein
MIRINWHPSAKEMRQWALVLVGALGAVGSLFYFIDWGIFAGGQGLAKFLWGFGAFAFLTGMTGTKVGLPAYWAWMGFVFVISSLIGYTALAAVFFFVVTPLAGLARLLGRDRLQLRGPKASSYWHSLKTASQHNPERPF